MPYLAHSAYRKKRAQTYKAHVTGVIRLARHNLSDMRAFVDEKRGAEFVRILDLAAEFHDLGKLNEENQTELHNDAPYRKPLPVEHRDAGVAYLRTNAQNKAAATLVFAHHYPGLPNMMAQWAAGHPFRFPSAFDDTEENLQKYTIAHLQEFPHAFVKQLPDVLKLKPLEYRMLLSCLTHADYMDSAGVSPSISSALWEERSRALDRYEDALWEDSRKTGTVNPELSVLRKQLFAACKNAVPKAKITYCGPLGTEKILGILAHLLQEAKRRGLRRIILVLPYAAGISQMARICGEALATDGEAPQTFVAEHHCRADYDDIALRRLSLTGTEPIIVTTAARFFESLVSNVPSKLYKIHQIPGSAVFIDECYAALPADLMLPAWQLIQTLASDWGCYFCFESETTVKFWETPSFQKFTAMRVEPLLPSALCKEAERYARRRTNINILTKPSVPHFSNVNRLIEYVVSKEGPRIAVLNTVQSAAVMAWEMRVQGHDVLHLSTALTPADREKTVHEISARLSDRVYPQSWTLVTPDPVEYDMRFSFRSGFCQLCSLLRCMQLNGQIGRNDEYDDAALYCLTVTDNRFNEDSRFRISIQEFDKLIKSGRLRNMNSIDAMTLIFENDYKVMDSQDGKDIIKLEKKCEFEDVAAKFRIEKDEPTTVIADHLLIAKLESFASKSAKLPKPIELQRGSVTLRNDELKKLLPYAIEGQDELLKLEEAQYDDFLGYMKGILPLL